MRPTFNFLGVWLAIDLLMRAGGLGSLSPLRHVAIVNTIPFGPLWFLGVYLLVVALSPWTASAHRRWGIALPLAMVVGVAVADSQAFVRNSSTPLAANLLLVWLIPHQLGYFYADGGGWRRHLALGSATVAATTERAGVYVKAWDALVDTHRLRSEMVGPGSTIQASGPERDGSPPGRLALTLPKVTDATTLRL